MLLFRQAYLVYIVLCVFSYRHCLLLAHV